MTVQQIFVSFAALVAIIGAVLYALKKKPENSASQPQSGSYVPFTETITTSITTVTKAAEAMHEKLSTVAQTESPISEVLTKEKVKKTPAKKGRKKVKKD